MRRALTPRLLVALAASTALHAVLVGALGPRSGSGAGPADAISALLVSEAAAQQIHVEPGIADEFEGAVTRARKLAEMA